MEEQAADLERRLARYYGDSVQVEYMDIVSERALEFPLVQRAVFGLGFDLPIVAFDGQPRIAGGMSIEMISEELEKRGVVGA
ncbi:MAG: hypothetical protein JXM73_25420 [Anaerolineae bacterium]|nr:hypothetical protein [Anaerolineae bacterium]